MNGPGVVNVIQVVFWVELPVQRRLCPNFVKLWTSVNGVQRRDIEITWYPWLSSGLIGDQPGTYGHPDFGASQLGIRA